MHTKSSYTTAIILKVTICSVCIFALLTIAFIRSPTLKYASIPAKYNTVETASTKVIRCFDKKEDQPQAPKSHRHKYHSVTMARFTCSQRTYENGLVCLAIIFKPGSGLGTHIPQLNGTRQGPCISVRPAFFANKMPVFFLFDLGCYTFYIISASLPLDNFFPHLDKGSNPWYMPTGFTCQLPGVIRCSYFRKQTAYSSGQQLRHEQWVMAGRWANSSLILGGLAVNGHRTNCDQNLNLCLHKIPGSQPLVCPPCQLTSLVVEAICLVPELGIGHHQAGRGSFSRMSNNIVFEESDACQDNAAPQTDGPTPTPRPMVILGPGLDGRTDFRNARRYCFKIYQQTKLVLPNHPKVQLREGNPIFPELDKVIEATGAQAFHEMKDADFISPKVKEHSTKKNILCAIYSINNKPLFLEDVFAKKLPFILVSPDDYFCESICISFQVKTKGGYNILVGKPLGVDDPSPILLDSKEGLDHSKNRLAVQCPRVFDWDHSYLRSSPNCQKSSKQISDKIRASDSPTQPLRPSKHAPTPSQDHTKDSILTFCDRELANSRSAHYAMWVDESTDDNGMAGLRGIADSIAHAIARDVPNGEMSKKLSSLPPVIQFPVFSLSTALDIVRWLSFNAPFFYTDDEVDKAKENHRDQQNKVIYSDMEASGKVLSKIA